MNESRLEQIKNSISEEVFHLWSRRQPCGVRFSHITLSMPAIAQVSPGILERITQPLNTLVNEASQAAFGAFGPAVAGHEALSRLVMLITNNSHPLKIRDAAVRAIGNVGKAAATKEVLDCLAILLERSQLTKSTMRALRRMGNAAATSRILRRLPDLMREEVDSNPSLAKDEYESANVVRSMGTAAATPEFLHAMDSLLLSHRGYIWDVAAWAMGGLGDATCPPAFSAQLVKLLEGDKGDVLTAVKVLRQLGSVGAVPKILDCLSRQLVSKDDRARYAGADGAGAIGSTAATPLIVRGLTAMLQKGRPDCLYAARAIRSIGDATGTKGIIDSLSEMLEDEDRWARSEAADALCTLSNAAGNLKLLHRLDELTRDDEDGSVRAFAAEAFCMLGTGLPRPYFLRRLAEMLRDWATQHVAARAIIRMGSAAGTEAIVEGLFEMMRGSHPARPTSRHGPDDECMALGALVNNAASPKLLAHLADLLTDPDMRFHAIRALAEIGSSAATEPILNRLAAVTRSGGWGGGYTMCKTIYRLGGKAAHPVILKRLRELQRLDSDRYYDPKAGVVRELGAGAWATQAVEGFMSAGARIFLDDVGEWTSRTTCELSN